MQTVTEGLKIRHEISGVPALIRLLRVALSDPADAIPTLHQMTVDHLKAFDGTGQRRADEKVCVAWFP